MNFIEIKYRLLMLAGLVLLVSACDQIKDEAKPKKYTDLLVKRLNFRLDQGDSIDFKIEDSISTLGSYTLRVENPLHGTIRYTGYHYTYTPDPNYYGKDSCTYTAENQTNDSISRCIFNIRQTRFPCFINVRPDSARVLERDSVFLDVLKNDDTCGRTTLRLLSNTAIGTASMVGNRILYKYRGLRILAGTVLHQTFRYQACTNGSNDCKEANVKIKIYGQYMPDCEDIFRPSADRIVISREERTRIPISQLLANDSYCQGDLDSNSFQLDYQGRATYGNVVPDRFDPKMLFYMPISSFPVNQDSFQYSIRRRASNTRRSARVTLVFQ
jgi:hypothetical protein